MTYLPKKYLEEMQGLLRDEYADYLDVLEKPSFHGLRVNTLKISVEHFLEIFPYALKPVPWTTNGFYYNPKDPVTKHPYYYAGLYYIQEPSAMLPGEVMPVSPYDKVLDICAAPGGKSTKLAEKLNGTGILVSNDVSVSRCQPLLKNLERFGVSNAFVMSETPARLKDHFSHYFNRILIDAPCSGEGMFRKDSSLIAAWEKRDSSHYAPIQKEIVKAAIEMLQDGGTIVYSTCTFNPAEDEEIIAYALSLDSSLHVMPITPSNGFVQNQYGTKLFPHRINGEGHFVSLLQKGQYKAVTSENIKQDVYDKDGIHTMLYQGSYRQFNEKLYYVPDAPESLHGLRVLRSGLLIGEEKNKRLRYSEAFALYLKMNDCSQTISFSSEDPRVIKYLKGETLDIADFPYQNGWILVTVDDYPLGFARLSGGVFKNMLGKNWIMH